MDGVGVEPASPHSSFSVKSVASYVEVQKGWGRETWITNNQAYCGKILEFRAGSRCSWHYHKIKDEVIYVESGEILFIGGETDDISLAETARLGAGESVRVFPGLRHQMVAITDSRLIEFSTHHRDEDSIRVARGD